MPTPTDAVVRPPNDDVAHAQVISLPSVLGGTTTNATVEAGEPLVCSGVAYSRTVWYSTSMPEDGTLDVKTQASGFDTVLAAYDLGPTGTLTPIACNNDAEPGQPGPSRLTIPLVAGHTYFIQVGGVGDGMGSVVLAAAWTINTSSAEPPAPTFTESPTPSMTPTVTDSPTPSLTARETGTVTVVPPRTPTTTPTLSPASGCVPRPPVSVRTMPTGDGWLMVTVSSGRGRLRSIEFGTDEHPLPNAVVEVPAIDKQTSIGFTYKPVPVTQQASFYLRRLTDGQAVTLPLVITDECGPWETFVGGGPSAF